MSAERLRAMLSEATPGPWEAGRFADRYVNAITGPGKFDSTAVCSTFTSGMNKNYAADARLIALAPDAIALLADMADALKEYRYAVRPDPHDYHERHVAEDLDAVFARLDALCGDDSASEDTSDES